MTEVANQARPRRWRKYFLFVLVAGLLAALGLAIYVNTNAFQALIRRRLVAEIERITGGRVEIASIHTIPLRLQVEVRGIKVHGRESASDVPLANVQGIVARLKISSLLRSELAFKDVILEQPVVHVIFYPDGTSNFPPRKTGSSTGKTPVERLFALSIDHLKLRHGQLLWDQQTVPMDFDASSASLEMDYSFLHRSYDGRLLLGTVETRISDFRPFDWMTAMEFTLRSNSAIVTSFKWNSGRSHVSANGEVTDFRRLHLRGSYDGHFDLAEAASIARRHDLRGGTVELRGHGDWSFERFSSSGLLAMRDVVWKDDEISFSSASLGADFYVSDEQLKLSKLRGKIFGGDFAGDAEFQEWLTPPQHLSPAAKKSLDTAVISAVSPAKRAGNKTSKNKPGGIQSALIVLHLHELSAASLTAALNSVTHPFPRFHPAASASGSIETRWKGTPRDAEVSFTVDLVPPANPASTELPLSGHADGVYYQASKSVELPRFTLITPASKIQASGTLSSKSALRLYASTTNLADWMPFLEAVRGPALFPVRLNGSAGFNGTMTGSISSPQLAGSLRVEDFDINLPATARSHEIQSHWDSLRTAIEVSFNSVVFRGASLRRDRTSANLDASATLQRGHVTGSSAFTLRASVKNVDVADIQAVAGYDYPVSGNADFLVQAEGTLSDPHGDGKLHLNNAVVYGETIKQFDSNFHIGQGGMSLDNLRLLHDDSLITGSAFYNPSRRLFRLDIAGNNFDLATIERLHPVRISLTGRADLLLKASGTPEMPMIDADLHLHNFSLDHEVAGDFDLRAVSQGHELHLAGNSRLQQGSLRFDGTVQLRNDYPAKLAFQLDHLDLDTMWRSYFRGQLTGHSEVAGSLDMRGPLFQPRLWSIEGNVTGLSFEIENVKLHNQDPIRFSLANQSLNIQQAHLLGDGTDLTAHGTVQLNGTRALDLTADGRFDLRLLSGYDSAFTSSGLITMNVTVAGTLTDPLPQGRLQVGNGAISYAGLRSGLSELNGSLLFTRDHMHIETLTARSGGGSIDLKGDAVYKQRNFNLTAIARDVRLRYPPGVSSTANAELHWVGSQSASTLSGEISINKIAVTPGFDFSAYLERSRQFSTVTVSNSPLSNIKLDIHVQTAPELQMRTAIARLSGDADFRLRGSVARPAVLGRVDVLEGQATFHGTRFTLERGDITFANPVAIEPQLNLQASTHVRNYDLSITVTGTPDRLNLNYRSEPPLPKSDIIALLALGRTNEESAQLQEQSGQSAFSDQATALILSQALNTTVSSRLQRLFGASNIKIDPQGLTTETNPTARGPQLTIEQEFVNNLSLTYSTNVSQSSQQIIQGEYYVNRNVSVVGTRDQNGVVSFDMRIRQRKK